MEPRIYEREGEWWAEFLHGKHTRRLGPFPGRHTAQDVLSQKLALLPPPVEECAPAKPRKPRGRPKLPEGVPAAICIKPGKREARVGARGVWPQGGGYIVRFMHDRQYRHFGWYKTLEEAAAVYDHHITRLRGPAARVNGTLQTRAAAM
jgi:hypothetical protein